MIIRLCPETPDRLAHYWNETTGKKLGPHHVRGKLRGRRKVIPCPEHANGHDELAAARWFLLGWDGRITGPFYERDAALAAYGEEIRRVLQTSPTSSKPPAPELYLAMPVKVEIVAQLVSTKETK